MFNEVSSECICLSGALKLESALVIALERTLFSTGYLSSCRCQTKLQTFYAAFSLRHKPRGSQGKAKGRYN